MAFWQQLTGHASFPGGSQGILPRRRGAVVQGFACVAHVANTHDCQGAVVEPFLSIIYLAIGTQVLVQLCLPPHGSSLCSLPPTHTELFGQLVADSLLMSRSHR